MGLVLNHTVWNPKGFPLYFWETDWDCVVITHMSYSVVVWITMQPYLKREMSCAWALAISQTTSICSEDWDRQLCFQGPGCALPNTRCHCCCWSSAQDGLCHRTWHLLWCVRFRCSAPTPFIFLFSFWEETLDNLTLNYFIVWNNRGCWILNSVSKFHRNKVNIKC